MFKRKFSLPGFIAVCALSFAVCMVPMALQAQNTRTSNPTVVGGATTAGSVVAFNADLNGNQTVTQPDGWAIVSVPATATQATVSKASATGLKHVITSLTCTLAAGATAQTPVNVYIRDGATGAGTILWAGTLSAPVNTSGDISISPLKVVGTASTAMTVEFSAAGVTASQEAVSATGYDSL